MDYGQHLRFGAFITPDASDADGVLDLADHCDRIGLDLLSVQDHPYQPRHLDTWTLLSAIAARTTRISVAPNVANLPLRPPAVLAKSVASLDLITDGRVELGLGAGGFREAIAALGGPVLTPGASIDALEEAIGLIRAVWDTTQRSVRHDGEHYRVIGARAGPAPAHPVEIWLGAYKPRMLRLTGRLADGWLPSMGNAAPSRLADLQEQIDDAAREAGRDPASIRRLYNVNGRFDGGRDDTALFGSARDWAEQLSEIALEHGMSTFVLASDDAGVLERFAEEVAPAVRNLVQQQRSGRQR